MSKSYFYTETAFHHEGDSAYLKALIDETAHSGANGIKFQVLTNPSDFISTRHKSFDLLSSFCFGLKDWHSIFEHSQEKGLDIIMMPLDVEALQLANSFSIKYIDIHSVSFNDLLLLNKIKESGLDVLIGTGGRTIDEIEASIEFFSGNVKVLMTGFQSFPTHIKDVKLERIKQFKNHFKNQIIGYADHTSYDNDSTIRYIEFARLLGATAFEIHITLRQGEQRTDYESAVNPNQISEIIKAVHFIEKEVIPEQDLFEMTDREMTYRNRQLRVVARKYIQKGKKLDYDDVALKMIDKQTGFTKIEDVIGKVVNCHIVPDCEISHDSIKKVSG